MSDKRRLKSAIKKAIKVRTTFTRNVDKQVAEAKKRNPHIGPTEIFSENSEDFFILDGKVKEALSKYWLFRADEILIPVPDSKDTLMWDRTEFGQRFLTEKGIHEVRKMVRTEIKDQHSVILPWIAIVFTLSVTLTGIANLWWNIANAK